MKQRLTAIKSIFFIIFCTFLSGVVQADVALFPGLSIRIAGDNGEVDYLRSLIRQFDRYARRAKLSRSRQHMIIICGKGGQWHYGERFINIPGSLDEWQRDVSLRRRLFGILAAHRFNYRYPDGSSGVAEWIVNGIDAELEAAATGGQYLVANRQYPLLGEAAAMTGKFPDFGVMCRMGIIQDPLMREFFGEQARLLLNIGADGGLIREIFEKSCNGERPDQLIKRYRWQNDSSEFIAVLERNLWDQYSPIPADLALKKLALLDEIYVQKTDAAGKLTGNFVKCSFRQLADMLKQKRSDAREIKRNFAEGYIHLAKMLSPEERKNCSGIIIAISRFGLENNDDAVRDFAADLEKLKKQLNLRLVRTRWFFQVLDGSAPLPDRFGRLLETVRSSGRAAGKAEMEFFRRTMNLYLQ